MISEKRSQAARANGARSRGPVTPEGKAVSARNAMRHGLLANTIVLSNEDPAGFKELFYLLVERFSPVDDVEMNMIEEMAASYWRLRRVWAMQTSLLESGIAAQAPATQIEQTTAAFCEAAGGGRLDLLLRYETRLHAMYQRALKNFILMRKIPSAPPSPPPAPDPLPPVPNEPKPPNAAAAGPARPAPPRPPAPAFNPCTLEDLPFDCSGPVVLLE